MDISRDTLFDGRLICLQHTAGYRFSVDAVLAAHFQPPGKGASILDLGSGCGIISLIVMYRWGKMIKEIAALEVQPQLAELSRRNFAENGFAAQCRTVAGDLRNIGHSFAPESFSQVICNPPFYREGSGRTSADPESLYARHQILASLSQIVGAAAAVVKTGGTVVFIYPAEGLGELVAELTRARLELKRLQCVYSYPEPAGPARLVLVTAMKNAGSGVQVLPPFYLYTRKNGAYSPGMEKLYSPHQENETEPLFKNNCNIKLSRPAYGAVNK